MSSDKPFSIESFLEKLAANDPEVALDPVIQAGLEKLALTLREADAAPSRLLLIENDDADAWLLESALKQARVVMEVTRVRDGHQALDYFEGNHPFSDRKSFPLPLLTFLDLRLPGIHGVDVLRRMRQMPDCAQLIVIVLTVSEEKQDIEEARNLNVSAYLLKPRTLSDLEELVRQIKVSWIDPILLR